MPTKRIKAKPRGFRITPEAEKAYRDGDYELLHEHLGLKPWEASPLDVDHLEQPSPWPEGSGGATSWPQAVELRRQLEEGQ